MGGGILKDNHSQEGCERHEPSTITVHPDSQENKQMSQAANLTKQRAHGGIQMKKKNKGQCTRKLRRGY